MKAIYSIPKLVLGSKSNTNSYIWFRYNKVLVKKTYDLNRIKNLKEREAEGLAIVRLLTKNLKNGWNPLVPDVYQTKGEDLTLIQALEYALEKKKPYLSSKSYSTYSCTFRFAKKAIEKLNLTFLAIHDTKRAHIKAILERIKTDRSWSSNAYNKALGHLQAILSELIQWDILEHNPAHKIRPLPQYEVNSYNIPTDEEMQIISKELELKDKNFHVFVKTLYYTLIRPVELTRLTIGMIDKEKRVITIKGSVGKTKITRVVPICDDLWNILKPRLDQPKEFYLFGSERYSGRGNVGLFPDFVPGPTQLKRDTATKRWKRIVKDGLGIEADLYGVKYLAVARMKISGIDKDVIRHVAGHTTDKMTDKYLRQLGGYYAEQVAVNYPVYE